MMKPLLKLPKPALHNRLTYAVFSLIMFSFSFMFIVWPLSHLIRISLAQEIAWPLVGFCCLSVPLGLLFMYASTRFHIWIFPYQFTVNYSEKVCGHSWGDTWQNKTSLEGVSSIVAELGWSSRRTWPWHIYLKYDDGIRKVHVLQSVKTHTKEHKSFDDCLLVCESLSECLEIPIEFNEWSEELLVKANDVET